MNMLCCIGQQRQMPRPLDCLRQRTLAFGANIGLPPGANLAFLGDIAPQRIHIFIIDVAFSIFEEGTAFIAAPAVASS